jgi:hypothetical protein
MSKRCISCGAEVPKRANFCVMCGSAVAPTTSQCSDCQRDRERCYSNGSDRRPR